MFLLIESRVAAPLMPLSLFRRRNLAIANAVAVLWAAAFSLGLSAKMVMRYGIRGPLALGLALSALGLFLFAFSPVDGDFGWHVLPGMLLVGLGSGMAFNPVLLAAMDGVDEKDSGLASGVVNTSFMMGGALGLAVLASLAAARTRGMLTDGSEYLFALHAGYQLAFLAGAIFSALGAVLALACRATGEKP